MEHSLSSLAFQGSITEAIGEAKQQKKLFVVYTAGDNPDSKLLETSTWIDPKVGLSTLHEQVCETVSKYCILLHILEGSSEASNFSAIYKQHSFPCITAVGYNGVQLWQKEGFVHADVLASSLEKAWLSLHVQETTAAFLTAALAKQTASGSSEVAPPEEVRAGTGVSASTTDGATLCVDAGQPLHLETKENIISNKDPSEDTGSKGNDVSLPKPFVANGELDEPIPKTETGNASMNPVEIGQNNSKVALPVLDDNSEVGDSHLSSSGREIIKKAREVAPISKDKDAVEVEKAEASVSSAIKSNDVFLNIRMPDGSSLQGKFTMTDTLKMVKDYIKENQMSSLGSFSIAIPYPRKVFNDQDMDNTLSELGLSNRQALIVVPYKQNNSQYREGSSQYQSDSSNEAGSSNASEGYWGSVKRILSYANVFSYLGRSNSTSVAQESQGGMWQYNPNPSLQNTLRDGGRPTGVHSSDQAAPATSSGRNSNKKSRPLTSSFGGNIHTLKHDEDDERFSDKNTFWNGNSTQFGGNDDAK